MPGIGIVRSLAFTRIRTFCSEYQAVYKKLIELGDVPDTLIAKEQNKMVRQDVAYVGWADVYDVFYLFAQYSNNGGGALINWINPGTFDATLVGTPAFDSLEGFTGQNTTNNYIRTHYAPLTDKINMSQNDASIGAYVRNNTDKGWVAGAADDGYANGLLLGPLSGGNAVIRVNSTSYAYDGMATSAGFSMGIRRIAATQKIFKNGVEVDSENDASTGITDKEVYILLYNNNGAPSGTTDYQVSCFFIARAPSDPQALILTNAVEALMDYNGKGVI